MEAQQTSICPQHQTHLPKHTHTHIQNVAQKNLMNPFENHL